MLISDHTEGGASDAATESADRLRRLIESGGVKTVFQPIVDLARGEVVAYEALSRPGPEFGFSNAGELFDTAERAGLQWELEEVTRTESIRAARAWPERVRLFLNSSPTVLADDRFLCDINRLVEATGGVLNASRIVLEITEQSKEQHVRGLAARTGEMRDAGYQLAIDDVGAGTSGMNRIMLLRPHWLKLDKEFVQGLDTDSFKRNLVRFFVHFARLSDVNVVAEGIEREEELGELINLGVRFGQGYYLARPAERAPELQPDLGVWIRERWWTAWSRMGKLERAGGLTRLSKPVVACESERMIGHAAADLRTQEDAAGVCVLDGRRLVGWCDRERVLSAIERGASAAWSIGTLARPPGCMMPPETAVADALRILAELPEDSLMSPVVVADEGEIHGVVPIRELLLSAASREGQEGSAIGLTGLPGRVAADRHLTQIISKSWDISRIRPEALHDVMIVDVRQFSDFNGAYGYELGDVLLTELATLLQTVCRAEPGSFVAHLGDDRFLVTGQCGRLGALAGVVISRFEAMARALVAGPTVSPDGTTSSLGMILPQLVALRALVMPGVCSRIKQVRELYRVEQQLRMKARRQERVSPPGRSIVVTDSRLDAVSGRKIA